ncbi:MAG: hypothetical protein ACKVIF_02510 [Rhodospirillales bacterium]
MLNDDFTYDNSRNFAAEEWARLNARDTNTLAVAEINREMSVGELIKKARLRAGQLINQGVIPGCQVIVARPNVIEFVVDYLAIRLCGAVLVNLPWGAGTTITDLAEILDAKVVILSEHLVGDNPLFERLGSTDWARKTCDTGGKRVGLVGMYIWYNWHTKSGHAYWGNLAATD